MVFSKLWYCFLGPKIYRHLVMEPEKKYLTYEPIIIESMPDTVIGVIRTVIAFTRSTWLLVVPYMYMRGYFTKEGTIYMLNVAGIVSLLFCVSVALRGIGRALNPVYCKFLDIRTNKSLSPAEKREALARFSYEFAFHDPDFDINSPQYQDKLKDFKPIFSLPLHNSVANTSTFSTLLNIPYDIFCDFAMRVIGRRMIYPGSLQFLNSLLNEPRDEARSKIILKHQHARRLKLVTSCSDEVDAFVVDQRSQKTPNGNKLVICTEGNGGFYEVGIMTTPLESGYSVLGWNHLGFGGSSGLPWSPNEHAAVDAVYKYARIELGFRDEDIILFAWSIGGYATSWLAMNYPNVHAVVIDASFDDLVPLAIARMPQFAAGLVTRGIRLFMDLRVSDQLKYYPGPVLFYRRTKDEIITTQMRRLSTNRGNNLALDLIEHRYPHLFEDSTDDIREYAFSFLSQPLPVENPDEIDVTASAQSEVVKFRLEEMSSKGDLFPSELGKERTRDEKRQMIEFLLKKYISDLADVHCTPLPVSRFRVPEPI